MLAKCCSASTSVGAMNAPWCPPCTAVSSAATATTVLPAPTSPCSSRCIGIGRARSAVISAITFCWSPVSVERQPIEEPLDERAGRDVLDALAGLLDAALAEHERELDAQQLVEHQPAPRLLRLAHRLGLVDARRTRRCGRRSRAGRAPSPGSGSTNSLRAPQRLAHPAAEVLRVEPELVGLRVDGGDLQPVVLVEQVDLGVGHLELAPVLGDLAEEQCPLGALGSCRVRHGWLKKVIRR